MRRILVLCMRGGLGLFLLGFLLVSCQKEQTNPVASTPSSSSKAAGTPVPVGKVARNAQNLIKVTEESLYFAIKEARSGNRLTDISYAVQSYVEMRGLSVVREFVGHGIGRNLHESPQVPNFGSPGKGVTLKAGMVLAIEPMINEKGPDVKILEDGWTAVTCDKGLSAHFEHTVAIMESGPEILTKI